jgi:hypothetical protein
MSESRVTIDDGNTENSSTDGEDDEHNGTKGQSCQMRKESHLLQFYPLQWQDILESSKKKFCLWMATTDPWPVREDALKEAKSCLEEALLEHKEAREHIEKGMCSKNRTLLN